MSAPPNFWQTLTLWLKSNNIRMTPQHSQRKHARLAPSKASTWTVCTASPSYLGENADRVQDSPSIYANEGTKAHEVADCLMKGLPTPEWADEAMIQHGTAYRDYCASLHTTGETIPNFVELPVPLFYSRSDKGHVDYLLMQSATNTIDVVDYKYGAGKKVYAERNKQLAIYGRSAIEEYDLAGWVTNDTVVRLHIYQPRCREEGQEPNSVWETTWAEFIKFTDTEIGQPAADILAGNNVVFAPSDETCRWCLAAPFCGARREQQEQLVPITAELVSPAPFSPLPPDALTDEQLGQVIRHLPALERWVKQCKTYAQSRAVSGTPLPGTKLVEGRGSRKWADAQEAATFLEAAGIDPYTRTLLSPFAAETAAKERGIKPKWVDTLTVRVSGKPTLVSDADKRPALDINTLSEFSVINDDEE
jgi:hypothetical protein